MQQITIDPEFQALIPPLSAEERAQLEANLLADGCRDPLVVWVQPAPEPGTHKCYAHDESKCDLVPEDDVWHCRHCEHNPAPQEYVLIDGHNRYEICTRNGIEYGIEEMLFDSRSDVIEWIIKNQFGRRNLSDYQRGVLALRMKPIMEERAKAQQGARTDIRQISDECKPIRTDEAVSELANVSRDTIRKIERIEEVAQPEVKALASAGEVSINLASQFTELPQEVQQEAIAAIAENHEPAKEVMREAVKKAHVANNSGNNEWYTPADYIALAREVMGGIDTDPATSEIANRTVQASQIFTAEDNGLTKQWSGRVWVNPPYAQPLISEFAEAIASKYESGEIEQACVLVNNGTETAWFQRMVSAASAVCFPKSRIKFLDPDGNPSGAPLQGQAVIYMGGNVESFADVFCKKGVVLIHA